MNKQRFGEILRLSIAVKGWKVTFAKEKKGV